MQAVRARIVTEQTVSFERFELPDSPKGADALIKVDRSIISAGTELSIYTGLEPDARVPGNWCSWPWTPGYGGIGHVLAVGPEVRGIEPGMRVYGIFHHGSHVIVDTANRMCVPVPDDMDSTTAAFARMGSVAITAYRRAEVALDDGVAIIGLGLVGNLAGQYFVNAGQRVIGIDPAAHRRTLAEECGFHASIDPTGLDRESLGQRVASVNLGRPARVVVDAVGDSRLVELGVGIVANNGQVIILGTPRAPYETNCTPLLKETHSRGIDIKGALEWIVPLLKRESPGVTTERNTEVILQLIKDGRLKVRSLCSHVIDPARLNEAYQGLLHRKDEYLGVVLDWEHYPAPATGS